MIYALSGKKAEEKKGTVLSKKEMLVTTKEF